MTGKERGMSYIAADILKPLDLTSLANAELVSDEWRQIILEEKLWKHLFNRNAQTDSKWGKISCHLKMSADNISHGDDVKYKKMCKEIAHSKQVLENNWKHFSYKKSVKGLDRLGLTSSKICIAMNEEWIVSGSSDFWSITGNIKIFDRKTLTLEKRIDYDKDLSASVRMEDIQIKGNHIVWILNNTMAMDKVFIWNIKEQMLSEAIVEHNASFYKPHLALGAGFVVTTASHELSGSWLHVRPFPSCWPGESVSSISYPSMRVEHLALDEKYLVVLLVLEEEELHQYPELEQNYLLELRSPSTLEVIRSKNLTCKELHGFHYADGWIAIGFDDGSIKIFEAESLILRGLIQDECVAEYLRFNSEYLISRNSHYCSLKVWDFLAAIRGQRSASELLLHSSEVFAECSAEFCFDEFQLVCTDDYLSTLVILEFL